MKGAILPDFSLCFTKSPVLGEDIVPEYGPLQLCSILLLKEILAQFDSGSSNEDMICAGVYSLSRSLLSVGVA